jgi:dienelactone hydrolase
MLRFSSLSLAVVFALNLYLPDRACAQSSVDSAKQSSTVSDWMIDVCIPPKLDLSADVGILGPLLVTDDGKKIETKQDWMVQRKNLRQRWLEFLGPMPSPRPRVQLETIKTEIVGNVKRELVRYDSEPDIQVEGYLLSPKDLPVNEKLPAIVALHPTTAENIDELAGLHGRDARATGLRLAELGYVVFCPRCFLWQDATDYNQAATNHRQRHPKTLGMAKMLYDAQRAVDVLESLPFVDPNAIGAMGHSLGAKETLYLAAFDDRIQVAVASEGGLGLKSTNWDAPWYLGKAIHEDTFRLNHHQLLAMIAPRPFLVLAGESGSGAADGDRSWPLVNAARPAWLLFSPSPRLGILNHRAGHVFDEDQFKSTAEWLDSVLKNKR